ncbi:hypothetical protein KR018_005089 [Drosophila ironensis]|nr:hypothetical protein KR018_005089 [Drosophila ironensis]
MGIKVKETTPGQIEELRERFNSKYASSPPADPFHPTDIDRIRNDHVWLQRFLEMYDLDMDAAFNKLWETCTWRKSYGANDLDESNLNQEYLKEGSVFVHSTDEDGKPLLVFRVRLHSKSKNLDELIRIVVYWVERTQREQHMTQITIFFDMSGTGLATMDLDFVKRIVETFKQYYPNTLNYILVFELAWVLNAAFKVVKALLPPKAVEILKMISKKDITQYVPKDNCLVSWGGSDNYEFSFVPEARKAAPTSLVPANAGDDEQFADRKVTFANTAPTVLVNSTIKGMHTPTEGMLRVDPKDFVDFNAKNADALLSLRAISASPVAYKVYYRVCNPKPPSTSILTRGGPFQIQTTSPEKFRVRPRCGVIQPDQTVSINIWLKSEFQISSENKDKFLVMAMPAPPMECGADIAELWRNKACLPDDVEQHRLVCRLDSLCTQTSVDTSGTGKGKKPSKTDCKSGAVSSIKLSASQLVQSWFLLLFQKPKSPADANTRQLAFIQNLQYVTLFLMLVLFAGFGYLMYIQLTSSSCGAKSTAYSCLKRK